MCDYNCCNNWPKIIIELPTDNIDLEITMQVVLNPGLMVLELY